MYPVGKGPQLSGGLECEITLVAWDGIIPSLIGQQIDVIMASMSNTAERQQVGDFSDKYYQTPAVIIADKSLDFEPTPESLEGKILGVQGSTTHQAYAQQHFVDTEIRIYQTQEEANQDLASGRSDAVRADSIAMGIFVEEPVGSCCKILGAVAHDPAILGLGVGAAMRKGDDQLMATMNAAIAQTLEDGTYEEITSRYFSVAIY
ncbi:MULTISPECIES: transporter substrate-binding domain-containing protein [Rhodobacterales]|uniref:transporter substrate-binding domain-containing protein n=1 Tax=Rhodobacterales TaxID=204455 RepID=UPI00215D9F15|nr:MULTISPECIES: transporter substrate-binding domain-containing protein [Rhodobacterales]MDO6589859.1 transporter substrate-binding domain-containing protein [Yoonia sp. 1_MG-2023]